MKTGENADLRVLFVDDDATTRARVGFLLRRNGYDVELANDGERAWQMLKGQHFSLIVTDWAMPNVDGLTLCRRIRAAQFPDYTYIILLTGHSEKTEVTRGLEAGADDYVTKPFDSGELLARVRVGQRILRMQARMQEQQRQLEEQASLDGLTGVLNRRALEHRLQEACSWARRRFMPLSVALLDLDRFKAVNDTYGHQAGDRVLQDIAGRVKAEIRDYDSVGRYGGEEFLLVFGDMSSDAAASASERIRGIIEAEPVAFDGIYIPVTTSIGVATDPVPGASRLKELVAVADGALYEAKRTGRNRVVCRTLDDTQDVSDEVNHDVTMRVG